MGEKEINDAMDQKVELLSVIMSEKEVKQFASLVEARLDHLLVHSAPPKFCRAVVWMCKIDPEQCSKGFKQLAADELRSRFRHMDVKVIDFTVTNRNVSFFRGEIRAMLS